MRVTRKQLERYQLLGYVAAVTTGAAIGGIAPVAVAPLERLVWPTLALLLYATFCQVRLAESVDAFRQGRFFAASLFANFVLVPAVVWGLGWLLPKDDAIKLGVYMVLLVPCTDWFVTFTHLGGGNIRLAVAIVPVQLLAQFAFLTFYLWLFMGQEFTRAIATGPFLQAFIGLIIVPFTLAMLTRGVASRSVSIGHWLNTTPLLPVPLLALTLFLVAASQVSLFGDLAGSLLSTGLVFSLYLIIAAPLARLTSHLFRLDHKVGRTLAFNMGTRNSFVVLPMALALPNAWEAAVAVIVLQTIVELMGIVFYLWWVPRRLFPSISHQA